MDPAQKPEEQRSRDLSPSEVERYTRPKKTWFIERLGDNYIFACEEAEAYELMYNRTNWMRRDFKILGVSDGIMFAKMIREGRSTADRVSGELNALEAERSRFAKAEENLIFVELVDPDDTESPENAPGLAKLNRIRDILAKYDKRLEDKHLELKACTSELNKAAFDAEFAVAKGHIERPSNQNIITPGASPEERLKILRSMNQA